MGSPALGSLSPSTRQPGSWKLWEGVWGCYQRSGGRLAAAPRESSARRGVSSTNRPERGSGGGFNRLQQPHSFTTLNREKTGFTPTLPGREGRREGSEGAGRLDHSFSSSTLLARSKVTDLRGGRHSNLVPLPAPRLGAREGGAASRAGLQRSAHWGLRGPGEARAERLGRRTPRGARRERTTSPLLLVTGFPKSAQTWEGRAGTPLQSSSISGAAPPGPSSSFQHSRCPGKTQSLAAAGPVLTFSFGPRSPAPERPRETRLRSRVPGAPNPLSGGGCG